MYVPFVHSWSAYYASVCIDAHGLFQPGLWWFWRALQQSWSLAVYRPSLPLNQCLGLPVLMFWIESTFLISPGEAPLTPVLCPMGLCSVLEHLCCPIRGLLSVHGVGPNISVSYRYYDFAIMFGVVLFSPDVALWSFPSIKPYFYKFLLLWGRNRLVSTVILRGAAAVTPRPPFYFINQRY